jgi:hypothetical protein
MPDCAPLFLENDKESIAFPEHWNRGFEVTDKMQQAWQTSFAGVV